MSNGYGMLTITDAGQGHQRVAIKEGGVHVWETLGHRLAFNLQRAPELEHYDIRKMSSEAIAKFLASKLESEAFAMSAESDGDDYELT